MESSWRFRRIALLIGILNKINTNVIANPKKMVINKFAEALIAFAGIGVAMLAFAGALKIMTTIPDDQIGAAILKLTAISVLVGAMAFVVAK